MCRNELNRRVCASLVRSGITVMRNSYVGADGMEATRKLHR